MLKYRVLTKNDNGEYILKDTEVFSLPLGMMANPEENSGRIDSNFRTALEVVSRWKIEKRIFDLTGKLEKILSSDVGTISDTARVKKERDALRQLRDQLPGESERPENWYIMLACTIERPAFMTFGNDSNALIRAIKAAADNADYKSVRDALLNFGKAFVPSTDSGIKPKKPSFRLNNPHDGRYSIEELVQSCTARKSIVTRKGANYKSVKDTDIMYSCLAEIFRECYGIPVAAKKAKRPEFKRFVI